MPSTAAVRSESGRDRCLARKRLISEYREKFANPYIAASKGYIDDVIDPRLTRQKIIRALEMLEGKVDSLPPKKHGNIPL